MDENRYGRLAARGYALDKPVGRSFGDVEFYRDRLAGLDAPVLEAAVGTGRVLVPLIEAGLAVEGFDASEEMLALCRAALAERGLSARVERARIESFEMGRRYGAVILPLGSFHLVTNTSSVRAALARIRAHLVAGGRLILDLEPPAGLAAAGPRVRRWRDGEEALTLEEAPAGVEGKLVAWRHRYGLWRRGKMVDQAQELFRVRLWEHDEIVAALADAGFRDVAVSGDYGAAAVAEAEVRTFEALAV